MNQQRLSIDPAPLCPLGCEGQPKQLGRHYQCPGCGLEFAVHDPAIPQKREGSDTPPGAEPRESQPIPLRPDSLQARRVKRD
ncbi:MAG: hypothetical protein ACLQGP_06835 [Isosphaeraceae bacterium]